MSCVERFLTSPNAALRLAPLPRPLEAQPSECDTAHDLDSFEESVTNRRSKKKNILSIESGESRPGRTDARQEAFSQFDNGIPLFFSNRSRMILVSNRLRCYANSLKPFDDTSNTPVAESDANSFTSSLPNVLTSLRDPLAL